MQETWVRSPGVGNGNPLQYSCLENSIDRGTLWATVHGIAKSLTLLSICTCGVSYKRCHVSQSGIWPAELKTVPFGYILDGVSIELLF